jgi:hypothetical protein
MTTSDGGEVTRGETMKSGDEEKTVNKPFGITYRATKP